MDISRKKSWNFAHQDNSVREHLVLSARVCRLYAGTLRDVGVGGGGGLGGERTPLPCTPLSTWNFAHQDNSVREHLVSARVCRLYAYVMWGRGWGWVGGGVGGERTPLPCDTCEGSHHHVTCDTAKRIILILPPCTHVNF